MALRDGDFNAGIEAVRTLHQHLQLAFDLWAPVRGTTPEDDQVIASVEMALDMGDRALNREPCGGGVGEAVYARALWSERYKDSEWHRAHPLEQQR